MPALKIKANDIPSITHGDATYHLVKVRNGRVSTSTLCGKLHIFWRTPLRDTLGTGRLCRLCEIRAMQQELEIQRERWIG